MLISLCELLKIEFQGHSTLCFVLIRGYPWALMCSGHEGYAFFHHKMHIYRICLLKCDDSISVSHSIYWPKFH